MYLFFFEVCILSLCILLFLQSNIHSQSQHNGQVVSHLLTGSDVERPVYFPTPMPPNCLVHSASNSSSSDCHLLMGPSSPGCVVLTAANDQRVRLRENHIIVKPDEEFHMLPSKQHILHQQKQYNHMLLPPDGHPTILPRQAAAFLPSKNPAFPAPPCSRGVTMVPASTSSVDGTKGSLSYTGAPSSSLG